MHWQEIDGWFRWRSGQEEAVRRFPEKSRFVEVGTYLGRSLCSLAELVTLSGKSIALVGVDTCRGSGPEGPNRKDYHQQSTLDAVRARPEILGWARSLYEALVVAEQGSSSDLSEVVDGIAAQRPVDRTVGPLIADLEKRKADRDAHVSSLQREVASWQARSARLQAEVDSIRSSTSWRLTATLRWLVVRWRARQPTPAPPTSSW